MKVVSGKHFCSVLEKHGWLLERIKGSHHIYSKTGNPAILSAPVHGNRDLRRGTQQKLMKYSGLTDDDL